MGFSVETIQEVFKLAADLAEQFTPPEYIPGCEVMDVTDKDLYDTNNGWIEAVCGQHNQQRCRWRGQFAGVQVGDYVDVLYFASYRLFVVLGKGGTGPISGGVWPYSIITVDPGGDADYTTNTAAISAASTGDIIENGGNLTEDVSITKALTLRGKSQSVILTGVAAGTGKVVSIASAINAEVIIENLSIVSGYTGANSYGIFSQSLSNLYKRTFKNLVITVATGSASRYGLVSEGIVLIENCTVTATTQAVQLTGSGVIRNCMINGNLDINSTGTFDIYGGLISGNLTTASGPTVNLHNMPTITGAVGSNVTGWYRDSSGYIVAANSGEYVLIDEATSNSNDIFRVDNASDSDFVATIASLVDADTITYNAPSSGDEANLVPVSTSQLAKMVLHNTTRGNSALILNCTTGTNTIDFTAAYPGTWQVGDTITIRSQTNAGTIGSSYFVDLQFTSGLGTNSSKVDFLLLLTDSGGAGGLGVITTYEAYAVSKLAGQRTQSTQSIQVTIEKPLISSTFCVLWDATGSNTLSFTLRMLGYNESLI